MPETPHVPHFIRGATLPSSGGDALRLTGPADGAPLGVLHPARTEVVAEAVGAAAAAHEEWGRLPVKERVQPLIRFRSLVERHLAELAECIHRENGKLRAEAEAGVQRGLEVVEFATALPGLLGAEVLEVSPGVDCMTRRHPLGVVAGITPFNFPAMVPMWMFPLAIACGNTFVLKPSEQVPSTPVRLGMLLRDAGLPDGVFNVVQGDRHTVDLLLEEPRIRAVAFVGSTPAARAVHQRGTANGKRVLALGGAKNHLVVVPDADPVATARSVAASATGCAGQRCMAGSVLIAVGDSDAIVEAIVSEMASLRPGVEMGPVISARARDRIVGCIDRAEASGAWVRLDGRGVRVSGGEQGFYVGPTILEGLEPGSPLLGEEIFGPVLTILRVDTLDEALEIENASPYGNAASIFTTSGAVARHFESRVRAGMVGINVGVPVPREPFGFGGWNESRFGVGDITGRDAILFWTQARKTTVKWTSRQTNWMS
ncbi:MAG: CoA-acylating methylmalonate-semialdehyde dehydrogenase [Verrucomicrobiales bacterium]|nr:CoA-acylating methylmalonate-semialdehyde dehydrogenase [Verrucomicrobiales bacterium]